MLSPERKRELKLQLKSAEKDVAHYADMLDGKLVMEEARRCEAALEEAKRTRASLREALGLK